MAKFPKGEMNIYIYIYIGKRVSESKRKKKSVIFVLKPQKLKYGKG